MVRASLGTKITIPGLKGDHEVTIPKGIQSGETVVLKGEGVPQLRSSRRGDLIVKVIVNTPKSLSHEQVELLKKFAELSGEGDEKNASHKKKKRGLFG